MLKLIIAFFIIVNFSLANGNVVKTSELELFLFKVGFDSLLKDVNITKEKTTLNHEEIKNINKKIDFIMTEMNKRNLTLVDEKSINNISSVNTNELKLLRDEIQELRSEIESLKSVKKEKELINVYLKYGKEFRDIGIIPSNIKEYELKRCTKKDLYEEWCSISYNKNSKLSSWIRKKDLNIIDKNIENFIFTKEKLYKVVNVAKDDFLNIRNGIDTDFEIIDTLKFNQKNIYIDYCSKENDSKDWCWISYFDKGKELNQGWVNKRYLISY